MQRNRPTLLLTRPEAASRRFLNDLRAAVGEDWPAVISPLMRTRFFDAAIPQCAHVVFTSETAVRAVARLSDDRTPLAWCVGPRTEEAAGAAGFRTRSGPGTAEGLASAIIAAGVKGPFLCPHATDRAFAMSETLKSAGLETVSVELYTQLACPPNAAARSILAAPARIILPLFSLRSARLAATAFDGHVAPLLLAAISEKVAAGAQALGPERVIVAERPNAPALIAAIARLADLSEAG